ncbi:MAG: ADP-ribosyltransferase [Clostridium sp.]|uniref:ADP-ribosyltransferase n=1 Tax=Bacteria TaxID=2 RepID=UPI003EE6573E
MTVEECKDLFKLWKESLTEEEKNIIYEYSKFLYEDVNTALLSKDNLFIEPFLTEIGYLDNALSKFKLPFAVEVYRADEENEFLTAQKIKEALDSVAEFYHEYPNFMSTSFSREAVLERIDSTNRLPEAVALLHNIKLSEGSHCGYLDSDLSYFPSEKEILVARGCFYVIDEVIINNIYTNIVETKGWCDFDI